MKYTLFILFFFFTFSNLFAQRDNYSTNSKKAISFYEEADLMIARRDFNNAMQLLYRALEKDNDFLEAHNRLAFCYGILLNLDGQQKHLEEVIRLDKKYKYKNAYFLLGKVYYNQGRYKEAKDLIIQYTEFPGADKRIIAEAEKFLPKIEYALEHIAKPVEFHPKPLSPNVNAFQLQYFPVLTADENTIFFTKRNGYAFYDDEDIFFCTKDDAGDWSEPKPISSNINSQFNEGTCTISADGQILIFTSCEGRNSFGSCDLYITRKDGNEWTVPYNLGPEVNSRSWESQPSLSADGRTLYFISDRAGGQGRRDIWVTQLDKDGHWKEAWNLGPDINTSEDEVSPFIHVNGITLFFASKGYEGFGGYDIYSSEKESGGWQKPKNIGYPINDHNDQVSLFVSTNGQNAYYSFERRMNGMPNQSLIFTFEYPENQGISKISNYITGNVYEIGSNKPLKAKIELVDKANDEVVSVFESNKTTGEYFSILNEGGDYALYVESDGYLFESRAIALNDSIGHSEPIHEDFYLKPIEKGERTQLSNIYFDVNSDQIRPESFNEIDRVANFLTKNPSVSIEISGHTDDTGSEEYNMQLSINRAKAVYNELMERGINQNRITYKGYGMTRPVSTNQDESSRQSNRRIEFEVLSR